MSWCSALCGIPHTGGHLPRAPVAASDSLGVGTDLDASVVHAHYRHHLRCATMPCLWLMPTHIRM